MNEQLAQLGFKDIHVPDAVSAWPPGPGWWIVGALLIVLGVTVYMMRKRKSDSLQTITVNYRQLARQELTQMELHYHQHMDNAQLAQDVNALLRRLVIQEYRQEDRQVLGSVNGTQWLSTLDQHFSLVNGFSSELGRNWLESNYNPKAHYDAKALLNLCHKALSSHLIGAEEEAQDA